MYNYRFLLLISLWTVGKFVGRSFMDHVKSTKIFFLECLISYGRYVASYVWHVYIKICIHFLTRVHR